MVLFEPTHQLVATLCRHIIMPRPIGVTPGVTNGTNGTNTMATPAINVQNLTKNYGPVLAVDDISFQVQPGELVGFLGPNGAGKSTTMRILTTYLPASSGYAWLAGFDVMYQSMEVRQRIGYLPESVPLYPEMRVERIPAVPRQAQGR